MPCYTKPDLSRHYFINISPGSHLHCLNNAAQINKVISEFQFRWAWGESIALLPHVREYKTVLDSGFYSVDSGFQSLGSRIPPSKFPRFQIKQAKKFPGFRIWIHLHGTSLGLQANPFIVFFLSKIEDDFSRVYSQIISTSRWVKKVELYTSMLTCISQDGNDLLILETEDSTIQPALLALLVLRG